MIYYSLFLSYYNRNVECGTLHCQGGFNKPIFNTETYSSHTNTGPQGDEVQCKVTSATVELKNPMAGAVPEDFIGGPTQDIGMVQDGTKCGEQMVTKKTHN